MIKSKLSSQYFLITTVSLISASFLHAAPFSKTDKAALCYTIFQSKLTKPEICTVTFTALNEDENIAVTIYKKQIFRMSGRTICDSTQANSCYVENETLAYGRPGKLDENEYMYLKENDGQTYYRNELKKKVIASKLFEPINDKWATCMKSKAYDICIQSKYSIEKIPKMRNEF
ncbi:hypothetical protein Q5M49_02530 [Acinetobacter nosocomialis]|uniref:hypothetical protein n=1 Tax=Acinetobacter nosocomialis TaxID=106654 RepID=UPI0026E952B6|nr:hypothetical protein [Acinetobacter nosocomialis]MDO7192565.1 hypothetical protein [Acinetobacter nosocomialis]MDO7214304.1 hypothetical protein [Acinetobacter nosocomialis]MDX7934832.1 hypothetical protein [Acinetobacter baumannii]